MAKRPIRPIRPEKLQTNRYIKLASAKSPDSDFIEMNDLEGFLCTSFQTLGISRAIEFLKIKNRQFSVDNQTSFKKYTLTIEILTKYSEYEQKHRELITFLDRNKKDGFRLYFRPYDGMDLRYCLCYIESSARAEKMQPVVLTLQQSSLWFGEEKKETTQQGEQSGNIFEFASDEGYYSVAFRADEEVSNYYCVSFYSGAQAEAEIVNNSYNEVPLVFRIYGPCVKPSVYLFRKGENEAIRELQINAKIDKGYYLEVNANILDNGVWYVNSTTGKKIDYSELVNNSLGSPYFYIDNGSYNVRVTDVDGNLCLADVFWQEEYSE